MISLTELTQNIQSYISSLALTRAEQHISLQQANGHILATDISAPFDLPRQNVSAMDGYAINTSAINTSAINTSAINTSAMSKNRELSAGTSVKVIGESVAGQAFTGEVLQGCAIAIMTGAIVPKECDTVVMKENVNVVEQSISLTQDIALGKNIRKQGEEISQNETLIQAGTIITPAHITLLASMGIAQVSVYQPIKVGIIASGDELKNAGEPLESVSQIYNANSPTLQALLAELPIKLTDYGIMPDDLTATKNTLTQASNECDVVITSAGVSVGDYDYLTTAISELGKINHYKVAMKPGKPFVFGEIYPANSLTANSLTANSLNSAEKSSVYFGLPGNPLSTFIGCVMIVKPALWQLAGANQAPLLARYPALLTQPIKKRAGRRDFQRGVMTQSGNGGWQVAPVGKQDSHRVKGLSMANCLIDLAEKDSDKAQGDSVMIIPFGSGI